ncbi:MAG TPA: IS110 family transposase [Ktedonobacteraceae bacterium]|nr:IS110 family transposase [Ktedonobacteraceae bacterium]
MITEKQSIEECPAQDTETICCVGIDISKASHVAGFVSQSMLGSQHFERCPTFSFENSRTGFEALLTKMKDYAPLERCIVLTEKTGHYGLPLEQFLQQHKITLYKIHVQQRQTKRKNDHQDALYLANKLYNQAVLGTQEDALNRIHRVLPPSSEAAKLHPLVQHRAEMTGSITVCRNRLTAICDELFPELTQIFVDPNKTASLNIRLRFPTPSAVAAASADELWECRANTVPGRAALLRLQGLARTSIGNVEENRVTGLCREQTHLIALLRLLQAQLDTIETEIETIIAGSREGKILASIPGISPMQAAIILASIGTIGNFERASLLRGYCGWSPQEAQSGTSLDIVSLTKGGSRLLKATIYMIAWACVRHDTEFKAVYERLIPIKCRYDKRTGTYRGRNKVVGRICGQIIGVIYVLLRQDYDLLAALEPGQEPPDPTLYSRDHHRRSFGKEPLPEPAQLPEIEADTKKSEQVRMLLAHTPGLRVKDLVQATGLNHASVSRIRRRWLDENLFNKQHSAKTNNDI